jgi:hypothetical protein
MRRRKTWVIGGLGLAAVLATGWIVLAQSPGNPPPPSGENVAPIPTAVIPPATTPGVPPPSPPSNWQLKQATYNQPPLTPPPVPPLGSVPVPQPPPQLPTPSQNVQPPKASGDLVQDLIQIIHETKSVDTFFVTTKLLEEMGGKARVAVPAIIRNAERLELFKDAFLQAEKDGDKQKKVELAEMIVDALEKIMNGAQGGIPLRPATSNLPAPVGVPKINRHPDPLITPTSGQLSRPPIVDATPSTIPPAVAPKG